MPKHMTTRWENLKGRARFLKNQLTKGEDDWARVGQFVLGDGAQWAKALCEEMDRLEARLQEVEKVLAQRGE